MYKLLMSCSGGSGLSQTFTGKKLCNLTDSDWGKDDLYVTALWQDDADSVSLTTTSIATISWLPKILLWLICSICSAFCYFALLYWLIEVVFLNGRVLSVSGISESVNERTHADQQKNKIPYSRGSPEVPMS